MKKNRRNQGLSMAMVAALLAATALSGCGGGNSDSGTTAAATSAAQAETTAAAETQAENTAAAESQAETATAETQAAESDLAAQVRGNTDPSPELVEQVNTTLDDSYLGDFYGLGSDYSVYDGRFDGVTLDIWMPDLFSASKIYPDMSQHPSMQLLSQLTGIKLNFITPTIGEEQTEFNLMVSGGDLPDIIINGVGNYPGGLISAAEDGLVLDLTPYEDKLPNYMTFTDNDHPELRRKNMVTDDGRMLAVYAMNIAEPYWVGIPIFKTKAMEDAGWTEVPETVDEWHSFLTDCKNAGYDIPLVFYPTETGFIESDCIATAFGAVGGLFINDEGKVAYGPVQDSVEDYLQTMNQWYEEGLIPSDFATADYSYATSMIASDQTAMVVASPQTTIDVLNADPSKDVKFGKFPVLNKGDQLKLNIFPAAVASDQAVITTQCENVDAALAFLDFPFSKKGLAATNFGSYGEEYLIDEEGQPYYPEDSLHFTDEEIKQNAENYTISKYRLHNYITYREWQSNTADIPVLDPPMFAAGEGSKLVGLPPITLTAEESSMIADIATNISTIQQEYFTKIIMGQLPLSAVQEFRDQAAQMGLDTYVSVFQDAYDRYLAK